MNLDKAKLLVRCQARRAVRLRGEADRAKAEAAVAEQKAALASQKAEEQASTTRLHLQHRYQALVGQVVDPAAFDELRQSESEAAQNLDRLHKATAAAQEAHQAARTWAAYTNEQSIAANRDLIRREHIAATSAKAVACRLFRQAEARQNDRVRKHG